LSGTKFWVDEMLARKVRKGTLVSISGVDACYNVTPVGVLKLQTLKWRHQLTVRRR
jgi:hypothetical protein